jgi:hypothetical protein
MPIEIVLSSNELTRAHFRKAAIAAAPIPLDNLTYSVANVLLDLIVDELMERKQGETVNFTVVD